MTNDTNRTHVPMCFNCNAREVAGEFSNASGEGFCSAECEREANEEFAHAHADEYDAAGDGWGHEDIMAMYDNDPSPYDGTYSEE